MKIWMKTILDEVEDEDNFIGVYQKYDDYADEYKPFCNLIWMHYIDFIYRTCLANSRIKNLMSQEYQTFK